MLDHEGVYAAFFAEAKKPGAGFAKVIKMTLKSGAIIRMTDHDQSITVAGEGTFIAEESFDASAMRQALGGAVGNTTAKGIVTGTVTEQDLIRGIFDDAEIRIGIVAWSNTAAGILWRQRGFLGQVEANGTEYEAELRALSDYLQRPFGRAFMGECDVREFGDARCGLDLDALGFIHGTGSPVATITALTTSARQFEISVGQADGYFQFGKIEFVTGQNAGWIGEIVGHAASIISLIERPPYPVLVGNQIILTRGCNRTWDVCDLTFGNIVNFRGFGARQGAVLWFMPPDEILAESPNAQ